jgi:coenzyme F420-reducing hydrogenase delta subunit
MVLRNLLDFTGIDTERIQFSWVSAAEGAKWADLVNTTVDKIRKLGPYKNYKEIALSTLFYKEELSHE